MTDRLTDTELDALDRLTATLPRGPYVTRAGAVYAQRRSLDLDELVAMGTDIAAAWVAAMLLAAPRLTATVRGLREQLAAVEREDPHTWRDCAERLSRLQVEGIDALVEQARREQAEIERDEARAALASEPARIAAAEMARDVAWVVALLTNNQRIAHVAATALGISYEAAATHVSSAATWGEDIAAAIRAARGAR